MRRHRRAVGRAIAIALVVGATTRVSEATVHPEDWEGPFLRSGAVGEPVATRDYRITVESIDGGRGLATRRGTHTSTGVWLVVHVVIAPDRAPAAPKSVLLVAADGRSYTATTRTSQPMITTPVQPGMAARGSIAFEVPLDIGDRVWVRALHDPDERLDVAANIEVPIDPVAWERWTRPDSTVELAERAVWAP